MADSLSASISLEHIQKTDFFSKELRSKQIIVTLGSGGAGKTTTAAAIGMLAARLRRKTLVMTIDPARRLATSLGMSNLGGEVQEVPKEKVAIAGIAPSYLYAVMLEPKKTFDELIYRFSSSPEVALQLISNPIYQKLSSRLAGSQEYAAMEKLLAIYQEQAYDLIVLDTPPTVHALDFLDAPKRMVDAIESPAINLLANIYRKTGKVSLNLLGFGATYVFKRLALFIGNSFLNDIAQFLAELADFLSGFQNRATQVIELLTRPIVGFIIVTNSDPRSIDEAINLYQRLHESKMPFAGFIINQVIPLSLTSTSPDEITSKLKKTIGVDDEKVNQLRALLVNSYSLLQKLAHGHQKQIQRLQEHCGNQYPYIIVPLLEQDIYDMKGLSLLANYL